MLESKHVHCQFPTRKDMRAEDQTMLLEEQLMDVRLTQETKRK